MSPHTRTGLALAIALLLWAPSAIGSLSGGTEASTTGLVFLGALAFSWIGTGILQGLINGYADGIRKIEQAKLEIELLEARANEQQNRRRTDDKESPTVALGDEDSPPLV